MTIRDIFSMADATKIKEYFCPVPILEMNDDRAYNICQGLQYYSINKITDLTTVEGENLTNEQALVVWRHFEPPMADVYEALGIDSHDEKAYEKIQSYLNQKVKLRKKEDIDAAAIRLIKQMHGMKHCRYDYIDRIRQTTDHQKLRGWLQEVENAIKTVIGDDPLHFYTSYPSETDIDNVHDLLGTRRLLLDRMFTYSDEEVAAFEHVNELLINLSKQMYHRTADLYRSILRNGVDTGFDDDYEVEGTLNTGVEYDKEEGDYDTVLHLTNDDYYGSDFSYMLYVLTENGQASHSCLDNIEECGVFHHTDNTPDMTDKELDCDWTFLNDGDSWIEWHRHPKFDHICVCHALHSLFDHHEYSLADIIRINSFWVEAKITCQRITDQKGRRFKEIREDE